MSEGYNRDRQEWSSKDTKNILAYIGVVAILGGAVHLWISTSDTAHYVFIGCLALIFVGVWIQHVLITSGWLGYYRQEKKAIREEAFLDSLPGERSPQMPEEEYEELRASYGYPPRLKRPKGYFLKDSQK